MAKQFYLIFSDKKIKLKRKEYILGRSKAQASIVIKNESISRQHAKLIVGKSSITIQDLGSVNGTEINNRAIKQNQLVLLREGMKIKLGEYEQQLEIQFETIDSDIELSRSRSRSNSNKKTQQSKANLELQKKQKIWNMGGLSKENQDKLKKLMGAKNESDDDEQEKQKEEIEKRNKELELQYKRAMQRQKQKGIGL
ncbi:unnamed protein product [Paramecium octaurelia]|uniref:FHA domain-containing protein n=1 Tax=Paramecium octaurelia TaxID=43137 RepID=A0A8S1SKZ3_PAROT|nr:unnamed protein product [Paramecium octaurelia]